MRDTGPGPKPRFECVLTLTCSDVAAVVFEENRWGVSVLILNRWLLRGRKPGPVLSWARRELASGARVAWLLADELDALP